MNLSGPSLSSLFNLQGAILSRRRLPSTISVYHTRTLLSIPFLKKFSLFIRHSLSSSELFYSIISDYSCQHLFSYFFHPIWRCSFHSLFILSYHLAFVNTFFRFFYTFNSDFLKIAKNVKMHLKMVERYGIIYC